MLRFVGDGDQKKFTKNPHRFSMQNPQANSKKKSTKVFWRAGKVKVRAIVVLKLSLRDALQQPPPLLGPLEL